MAKLLLRHTPTEVGVGVVGLEANGLVEIGKGSLRLPKLTLRYTPIMVLNVVGLKTNRSVIVSDGGSYCLSSFLAVPRLL